MTGQKEEKKEKEKKEEKKFLHTDRLKKGASSSAPLDFGPCLGVLCAAKQSFSWEVGRPRTRCSSRRPQEKQCSPSLEKVAQQRIADALNTLQGRSKLKWTRTSIGDKKKTYEQSLFSSSP